MSPPISTATCSLMRFRSALETPQSLNTVNSVGVFGSPSRSELLVEPHELAVPETPQHIYKSIIPTTDSLGEFFKYSPTLDT